MGSLSTLGRRLALVATLAALFALLFASPAAAHAGCTRRLTRAVITHKAGAHTGAPAKAKALCTQLAIAVKPNLLRR